jgi:hypothetical protein
LFLFLAVLILPSVMIAVQGRRLSVQERELAKTRSEEIRKRTAAEIGQEIVTRLERISSFAWTAPCSVAVVRDSAAEQSLKRDAQSASSLVKQLHCAD